MEKIYSCFVAMGYGEKKILGTKININLDDVYFKFIKPVIIQKNLKSIYSDENFRGDEIITTESISKNFLRSIYLSDFVIADISTLNQNAIYELGLRHAMKPKSTLILCDTQTFSMYSFFDISMQPQLTYNYNDLLNDPNYLNELQFKLSNIIDKCISSDNNYIDSPVFDIDLYDILPKKSLEIHEDKKFEKSIRTLIDEGDSFYENANFIEAEKCFESALKISKDINIISKYIVSKYKKDISIPNLINTLNYIKCNIDLDNITNENILGSAAAINKNLFALTKQITYYDASLQYYRTGSNYESGNLYCARNYCAMLLKKYLVSNSKEELKEYFYTAKHNAKNFINRSRLNNKKYTYLDDIWYNSNINDLLLIVYGNKDEFIGIKNATKRQRDTINAGRKELEKDYNSILSYIK